MADSKYEKIYKNLKAQIESGKYPKGSFLPSENQLIVSYDCARNTVRRAIAMLNSDGYLLSQHGKGAQVIYEPHETQSLFSVGGIESLSEATVRNNKKLKTKVLLVDEIVADDEISMKSGFNVGEVLVRVKRIRYINNEPLINDYNLFLKSEVGELNKQIAASSIYDHLENDLGMIITTSRRRVTAEHASEEDKKNLRLSKNCDFVLVVKGQVFNSKGIMFEYTESRHHPEKICFIQSAIRNK